MTVTTTSPAVGVTRSLLDQSSKLSAALKVSAPTSSASNTNFSTEDTQSSVNDTSALAQSPTVSFRLDALSIAFTGSNVDVLDSGASQVSRLLGQLQSLATRASTSGLSKSALLQLDGQFQAVRLALNNVPPAPPGVEYTPEELTQSLPTPSTDSTTKLGGFNDVKLLADANLQTPEAAAAAVETVNNATAVINAQRSVIADLQNDVDFAGASVDTAVQNQDALRSNLTVADVSGNTAGASLVANLAADPQAAIAAQTARLPDSVLKLLQQ